MKLAITIWGNRISPVFDAATTLLIAEIQRGMILKKTYKSFRPEPCPDLISLLRHLDVSLLICGAISTGPADLITANGIGLASFVTGNALEILDDFATRERIARDRVMPGCTCPFLESRKKPI